MQQFLSSSFSEENTLRCYSDIMVQIKIDKGNYNRLV